jgi:AcrR family transcriptional regulator
MARPRQKTAVSKNARTARETTAEQIVRVTLRRIRQGGFASVSMRQVASELGITATALYHHFHDKDALLDTVAARIFDAIPLPDKTLFWTERLRQLILAQHDALLAHPGLSRFVLMRRAESPGAFRWMESILQVLHDGSLEDQEVLRGVSQLSFLVNPLCFLDSPVTKVSSTMLGETVTKQRVMTHPERYPRLAAMLDHITAQSYASQFEVALEGVIAGLQAYVEGRGPPTQPGQKTARTVSSSLRSESGLP